jgi:hypothetical protein
MTRTCPRAATGPGLIVLGTFLLLAAGFCAAFGAEPAKKPPKPAPKADSPKADSPQKGLDGLGFSIAPREGGKARTSLFGLVGEGYKFAYVFDRSGSMGGKGGALRAVKAELVRSLDLLDTVHQFQIVHYNEKPVLFNPSGTPGRLAFATDENKQRAANFLDSLTAGGGTDHEEALKLAIRLQPDVIFFMTDGDDPKLSGAQLEKLRHMAAGIIINAVEFGHGPKPSEASFLSQLAQQNGGGYAYVDLTKPRPAPPAMRVEK